MKQILQKIREKPQQKKERLIITIVGVVVIFLLLAWLVIGNSGRNTDNDTSIIDDIGTDLEENQGTFPELFQSN